MSADILYMSKVTKNCVHTKWMTPYRTNLKKCQIAIKLDCYHIEWTKQKLMTQVVDALRQSTGSPDKSNLMEKRFESASTKYQTLDDILHNSDGKDSVSKKVTELFLAIEKDMLGDSSAEEVTGIKTFLHKKKTTYMARYVPKK